MISKKSDYHYVNLDNWPAELSGEIFPLRSGAQKYQLQFIDWVFALEAIRSRRCAFANIEVNGSLVNSDITAYLTECKTEQHSKRMLQHKKIEKGYDAYGYYIKDFSAFVNAEYDMYGDPLSSTDLLPLKGEPPYEKPIVESKKSVSSSLVIGIADMYDNIKRIKSYKAVAARYNYDIDSYIGKSYKVENLGGKYGSYDTSPHNPQYQKSWSTTLDYDYQTEWIAYPTANFFDDIAIPKYTSESVTFHLLLFARISGETDSGNESFCKLIDITESPNSEAVAKNLIEIGKARYPAHKITFNVDDYQIYQSVYVDFLKMYIAVEFKEEIDWESS